MASLASAGEDAATRPSTRAGWYAVLVFSLAPAIAFFDRGLLGLVVGDIKAELQLTDIEIGLIVGFPFVILQALIALPIGRLADRGTRRTLFGAGVVLSALGTAACGLAGGFVQLLAARIAGGAGEAATGPAAFSALADLFPRERLGKALAVMQLGFTAGQGAALIAGGALVALAAIAGPVGGWRAVLVLMTLPGLAVAALALFVREPARRDDQPAPAIRAVVAHLIAGRAAYAPMMMAVALMAMLLAAQSLWGATLFSRSFGWSASRYALVQGAIMLVAGSLGAVFGGWLTGRLSVRGRGDAEMRVVYYSAWLVVPLSILFPLLPSAKLVVAACALLTFAACWTLGPQVAAIQLIAPNRMRGQMTALFLLAFNMTGFGLGPLLAPLLADLLFRDESRIGWGLTAVAALIGPLAILFVRLSLKPYAALVAEPEAPPDAFEA